MLVQKCVISVDDLEKMPKLFLAKFGADNLPKFSIAASPHPRQKNNDPGIVRSMIWLSNSFRSLSRASRPPLGSRRKLHEGSFSPIAPFNVQQILRRSARSFCSSVRGEVY